MSRVGVSLAELAPILARLSEESAALESPGAFPTKQLAWLAPTGVLGWVIPDEFGGCQVSPADLLFGYEQLAEACLVTTFVMTQRNGACQRIAGSGSPAKAEVLPRLAAGEIFATVGISHLTTSRQHWKQPPVRAERVGNGYQLNGTVPWVTGAPAADLLVTGATLDDGRQILGLVRTNAPEVEVGESAELLALTSSKTGPVILTNAHISDDDLLAGPQENVMRMGQGGGAGSLTTSALAVGTARRALSALREEADKRPPLEEIWEPLDTELTALATDMHSAAADSASASAQSEGIRQRANSIALRSTQSLLAASKGAGFVSGHVAERSVREAMFFLVWSCPQPVLQATLRELACLID